MRTFKLLIYEDDSDWVESFKYSVEPKLNAIGISLRLLWRGDDTLLIQDLQWVPDLIMIDHDLGVQVGTDIIGQIDQDPQYEHASLYYYSGGETIDALRNNVKSFRCGVHCYIKDGRDLERALINKAQKMAK